MNGFTMIKEFLFKCDTCGAEVPSGIVNIVDHWGECAGKETMEKINKIAELPLYTNEKLALVKQLLKIEQ